MSECLVLASVRSAVRFRTYMMGRALCSVSDAGKCTDGIHGVTLRHGMNMWHPVTFLNLTELHILCQIIIFMEQFLCTNASCI